MGQKIEVTQMMSKDIERISFINSSHSLRNEFIPIAKHGIQRYKHIPRRPLKRKIRANN